MLVGKYTGLRAIELKDLAQLLDWRNIPEFRRFFREYRELGEESQKRWFETRVLSDEHTRMFSIVKLGAGELIGACGLCYIDWINQCADFSIYIGKNNIYIDDVYAIDAAKVLMSYGFDELNLHRLWSEVYDFDEKKKIMFEKINFSHEATHKSTHWTGGKWVDSLYYRLLRDDYYDTVATACEV